MRYENLLKQQQVPVLDNLPVGGLRHAADLRAPLLIKVKVNYTVKTRFALTSTSSSGRRLTRAVSRIVSSPTFDHQHLVHWSKIILHLVEVVSEAHVVVDQVGQGGLFRTRQLLLAVKTEIREYSDTNNANLVN